MFFTEKEILAYAKDLEENSKRLEESNLKIGDTVRVKRSTSRYYNFTGKIVRFGGSPNVTILLNKKENFDEVGYRFFWDIDLEKIN